MTPTIAAALAGFFVFSGVGGMSSSSLMNTEDPVIETPTYPAYSVSMTGYNAVPEQTDSDPFTTASGARSNAAIMAARSSDLADEMPFGTVVAISTNTSTANCGLSAVSNLVGLRVIGDSMHPRKRNQIDILFDETDTVRARGKQMNPALVLGMCKDIQVVVVGHIDIKRIPKTQAALKLAVGFVQATPAPLAINK